MTREDIIRMAREAAILDVMDCPYPAVEQALERFAALVAAAEKADEREACCQIVYGYCGSDNVAARTVEAIKARGT
jgi:hypothetical protein